MRASDKVTMTAQEFSDQMLGAFGDGYDQAIEALKQFKPLAMGAAQKLIPELEDE